VESLECFYVRLKATGPCPAIPRYSEARAVFGGAESRHVKISLTHISHPLKRCFFFVLLGRTPAHGIRWQFTGEQTANITTIANVPNRSCGVYVTDLEGIEHTAHVTADTLYEAVARGLKAIKSSAWAGEIPAGITSVTVCAAQPEVEHHVRIAAFKSWMNRPGGSPSDKMARLRIREILGL
jgi:hypothetical protein